MKSVKDYIVLEEKPQDLPKKVLELVAKGWMPLGGVSASPNSAGVFRCYQAMVLPAETAT